MYYQNYEDYMRQVLGYPINDPSIYESYDYRNRQSYEDTYSSRNQQMFNMSEQEIQACYPEIYHLVYPMVCKVCDTNTQPITRELIERMTDEVYLAMEDTSTVVNIRANIPQSETERVASKEENRTSTSDGKTARTENIRNSKPREERTSKTTNPTSSVESNKSSTIENREVATSSIENRQFNSNLRDLIKILILFRLFGNRLGRPNRPRPPFQGRPPFPDGRPPMRPNRLSMQQRDYQNYLEF